MVEGEVCLALLSFALSDLLAKVCDTILWCVGRFATSLLFVGAACLALAMLFGGLSFELLLPVLQISLVDTILDKLPCDGDYTIATLLGKGSHLLTSLSTDHLGVVAAHEESFLGTMLAEVGADALHGNRLTDETIGRGEEGVHLHVGRSLRLCGCGLILLLLIAPDKC